MPNRRVIRRKIRVTAPLRVYDIFSLIYVNELYGFMILACLQCLTFCKR